MTDFWSSPVLLALGVALLYGTGTPIMKAGMVFGGVTPNGMLIAYGVGAVVVGVAWNISAGAEVSFGTTRGIVSAVAVGLMLGIAFVFMTRAFSLPTGAVTVVATLVATYPVLASVIEIVFMDAKIRPVQALLGCILVVAGGVLVSTSTSPQGD
jgi:uncharacterized membrane protein